MRVEDDDGDIDNEGKLHWIQQNKVSSTVFARPTGSRRVRRKGQTKTLSMAIIYLSSGSSSRRRTILDSKKKEIVVGLHKYLLKKKIVVIVCCSAQRGALTQMLVSSNLFFSGKA